MITVAQWRRAMTAGILFVVLFVVGVFLVSTPDIKKKDTEATASAKYAHWISNHGHRVEVVVSAYLLIVAGILFVWFIQALRTELLSTNIVADRTVGALSAAGAGVIAAGAIINATIAGSILFGDEPVPDGDTIRVVMDIAFPMLFVAFGLIYGAIIAAFALVTASTRALPRWVAYTGWLGVLGAILGVIFLPVVLPLLWFLIVAIVGLTRPPKVGIALGHEAAPIS
jgi:hypothetical protein